MKWWEGLNEQICAHFGEGQTEFILTSTKFTGNLFDELTFCLDAFRSISIHKKFFWKSSKTVLTLLWRRSLTYRNQVPNMSLPILSPSDSFNNFASHSWQQQITTTRFPFLTHCGKIWHHQNHLLVWSVFNDFNMPILKIFVDLKFFSRFQRKIFPD